MKGCLQTRLRTTKECFNVFIFNLKVVNVEKMCILRNGMKLSKTIEYVYNSQVKRVSLSFDSSLILL